VNSNGDINKLLAYDRKSLQSGFNSADPDAIIAWDNRMQELVRMDGIAKLIRTGKPATEAKNILRSDKLTIIQEQWLEKRLLRADFSEKIRLFYYLGVAIGGQKGTEFISKSFNLISDGILKETVSNLKYNENCRIAKDKHTVRLPLRVNWGGGWSDTPPYCNEKGGAVLNAAILLNGEKPVEVTLETDNGITLRGNMLNFALGIGKYNGGGMLPFPNADTKNNLFEVLFISNMPKIKMLFALPKLFNGTLDKVTEVKYIRSQKIKLSSASPIFAETDGEVIGYTPILFDIEPMAFCYFSK
jgi:hypothetical protein